MLSAGCLRRSQKRPSSKLETPAADGLVLGESKKSRMNFTTSRMKNLLSIAATFLCSTLLLPGAARAKKQADAKLQPAPATTVTVDGSEAMFTTMCALL